MILWQVAERSGSTDGQVIVHVALPQVYVAVDDRTYWVESLWDAPIVCGLRPGCHRVRMLWNGRVLYHEEFKLAPGEERILTAWDGATPTAGADFRPGVRRAAHRHGSVATVARTGKRGQEP
jgi:hypothetical protein